MSGKDLPRSSSWLSIAIILVCWVSLLAGCATLRPEQPEVNLMGIRVSEVTLSHVNLLADLRVYNPNPSSLDLERLQYVLDLNGVRIFSGGSRLDVSVPAGDYATVPLRISGAYWDIFQFLNSAQQADALTYAIRGDIQVGGISFLPMTFPFSREGSLPGLTHPAAR